MVCLVGSSFAGLPAFGGVETRTLNNGRLILEDVPQIPREVFYDLYRFQSVRAAAFRAWTPDSQSLYVSTGFGDVDSIHRLDMPLGARRQVTFYEEPVGGIAGQPGADKLLFLRDAGGSELAQIFLLDPLSGDATMLSDGESRNGALLWSRRGTRLAYHSTRRNGAANDIWIMDPLAPDSAKIVLASTDGSWWGPAEFSASGSQLLVENYLSATDSRVHLVDLDTGANMRLAGGSAIPAVNNPVAFDDDKQGFWFITDQHSEFKQLAWQALKPGAPVEIVTANLSWSVTGATISHDRRQMAFVTNEGGPSQVYLLDTNTRQTRKIEGLPTGLAYGLQFSPDDRRLAMTLNTPQTPSDTYVLTLAHETLEYGALIRWTESELGGLDESAFRVPELIDYASFDKDGSVPRLIPAWVYKPPGKGPHPVVVSIHGGPEGQARPAFSSTYQMWIEKLGVAVVLPNVRGSSGYGKTYLGLDNGFKREDSVKDIGALLDWIKVQPDLDQDRVALFGGSYGGYMVLAGSMHYGDRLKAAVDNVGISNFVTFLENTQDYRRDLRRVEYGDEREPSMRAFLQRISPLNNAEKITVPLFIVQGKNDPRVPVTESEQMVRALRQRGRTVWYMKALNEGHGYRKRENRDIYQQATVLFLRQHLLGN